MKWRLASLVIALASACASVETRQQPEPRGSAPIAEGHTALTAAVTSTAPDSASARARAAASPAAPTPLEVHFIDVGTGDCIWIHTGDDGVPGNGRLEGYDIVIDGGDRGAFGRINGHEFASAYLNEGNRLPAAMLFHVGTLWRLYEADLLKGMKRISSVSGGSITAGVLGLKWKELTFQPSDVRDGFVQKVVAPIRRLADRTIDANSIIGGIFLPGTISEKIAKEYREHLYGNATLQDLPPDTRAPRFVINATNVQSGVLWRFSRTMIRDYRVGQVPNPRVSLATAVAASSAFPPVLSPCELKIDAGAMQKLEGNDLHEPPYTTHVYLTDGGVYDNLGLETIWKRYDTILVSDAGGHFDAEPEPKEDWARHAYRVLNLVDSQVRSLRKRQVIDSFKTKDRKGADSGIRTDIADYELGDALPCAFERTTELANTPTRLKRLSSDRQERLINWGYAVCDAALRKHMSSALAKPAGWPFPESTP